MPKKSKTSHLPSYTIGVDLGGTKMLTAVFDAAGKLVAQKKSSSQNLGGSRAGIEKLSNLIHSTLTLAGIQPSDLNGVGMACPGLVDPAKGILRNAPNLGWSNVPLATALQRTFNCPAFLINDVDAGTLGEALAGAGKGAHSVAGIFPGTGVGAGFVYEGRLLTGRRTSCMEIGLIYVPGTDLHSPHKGLAMLENLCGRLAISAAANTACYRGQAPKLTAATKFDLRKFKSKALSKSVAAGEKAVIRILLNAANSLSFGVATLMNLLAPEIIVFGGGLVEDLPNIFFNEVVKGAQKIAQPSIAEATTFQIAQLGGDAVALGAALYLRNRLLSPST